MKSFGTPNSFDNTASRLVNYSNSQGKRRYMVVPNQREAEITIRQAMREMVQLNQDHEFSYSRDDLVRLLDEALGELEPAAGAGGGR